MSTGKSYYADVYLNATKEIEVYFQHMHLRRVKIIF